MTAVLDSTLPSLQEVLLDRDGLEKGLLGRFGHPPAVVIASHARLVSAAWSEALPWLRNGSHEAWEFQLSR